MPKKKSAVKAKPVEVPVVTEDDQLLARQKELLTMRDWMVTNKIHDIGKLDVELASINVRV